MKKSTWWVAMAFAGSLSGCSSEGDEIAAYLGSEEVRSQLASNGYSVETISVTDATADGSQVGDYRVTVRGPKATDEVVNEAVAAGFNPDTVAQFITARIANSVSTALCGLYRTRGEDRPFEKTVNMTIAIGENEWQCTNSDTVVPLRMHVMFGLEGPKTPTYGDLEGYWKCSNDHDDAAVFYKFAVGSRGEKDFTFIDENYRMFYGEFSQAENGARLSVDQLYTLYGTRPVEFTMPWSNAIYDGKSDHLLSFELRFTDELTKKYACSMSAERVFGDAHTEAVMKEANAR